ncbi:MAG: acetyltransferase [Flaviramulus sp.]|nr:acetyltransferase [Flaviramulus sp.]
MSKICLFGASGHGKVVKDLALSLNTEIKIFVDDNPKRDLLQDIPVIKYQEIEHYKKYKFIISIGDNTIRKRISEKLESTFAMLIHKTAIISSSAKILEGTVVMPGAIINAETSIGKHVIINTAVIIEHDCIIDDFVHISPNATITGNVSIGEGSHIGAGAIIIPNISIGKWVTIGAGTVVIENVPDFAIVVGNPGKIKKYNKY